MVTRNIFVLGLDDVNLPALRRAVGEDCAVHPLLPLGELQRGEVSVAELRASAERALDAFEGSVDAVVGYRDFPISTLVPLLAERYNTRSTSLRSVAKCEHKYWSRLEQREVTDACPAFGVVDVSVADPVPPPGVRYPMWLKPALSYSSELAFAVHDERELRSAAKAIRDGAGRLGRPFEYVLSRVDAPPEVARLGSSLCLAEERLTGVQVAVEGYAEGGEVTVYGVLDSINYPGSSSFLRHQYPSALPAPVLARLRETSVRVIRQLGLDHATFSIEYFYDPGTDRIGLLEVNPRHSQSHALLFEYVDGLPNHYAMIRLALGEDPRMPTGAGPYTMAAKWYYRSFADSTVHSVPGPAALARIEREIPGVRVTVPATEGGLLSGLAEQDSYSYDLAHIVTAGNSESELREKYDRAVAALGLRIEAVDDEAVHNEAVDNEAPG